MKSCTLHNSCNKKGNILNLTNIIHSIVVTGHCRLLSTVLYSYWLFYCHPQQTEEWPTRWRGSTKKRCFILIVKHLSWIVPTMMIPFIHIETSFSSTFIQNAGAISSCASFEATKRLQVRRRHPKPTIHVRGSLHMNHTARWAQGQCVRST